MYLNPIEVSDLPIQIIGHRACMVRQEFKDKLVSIYKKNSEINHTSQPETSNLTALDKIFVLNEIKKKRKTQSAEPDINQIIQRDIKALEKLEHKKPQTLKLQNSMPYIFAKGILRPTRSMHIDIRKIPEEVKSYFYTIHEKVDIILRGTENDPIARAQFDNLLSRLAQTYGNMISDLKLVKEK